VINDLRPESGVTIGVFGTGAVDLSAIMAAAVAGCTTIVGMDVQFDRSALARELGATHVVNGAETDAVEEIKGITGCGANYSLDSTGVPAVLRRAVDAT
jgi:aryl-alcohol dehydrogenase